jgi:hypothetical protein
MWIQFRCFKALRGMPSLTACFAGARLPRRSGYLKERRELLKNKSSADDRLQAW